jgi:hypothetical protein
VQILARLGLCQWEVREMNIFKKSARAISREVSFICNEIKWEASYQILMLQRWAARTDFYIKAKIFACIALMVAVGLAMWHQFGPMGIVMELLK